MPKATAKAKVSGSPKPKLQQHQTRRFYWPEYHTTKWRHRRKSFLEINPLCVECEKIDRVVEAQVVDHSIPIEDGCDPWNEANWQGLCRSCDARKRGQTKRKST